MAAAPNLRIDGNDQIDGNNQIDVGITDEPMHLTLLDLVEAVSDVTNSEVEVVATVLQMLESRRVCLIGNFRDVPISVFS